MIKARKMVVMLLMVFGAVNVSFGVDLYSNEEPYQKLKAELAEYGNAEECKWSEDGKLISGNLCQYKNVIAFFDEIRAIEDDKDDFHKAVEKVREIPRFKNDSGIYPYVRTSFSGGAVFKEEAFWERVFDEWDKTKRQLRMDGARSGYWKKLAE